VSYYLGLDFGTSGARAALIDAAKVLQFESAVPFETADSARTAGFEPIEFISKSCSPQNWGARGAKGYLCKRSVDPRNTGFEPATNSGSEAGQIPDQRRQWPETWTAALWQLLSQIPANLRSQLTRIAINATSATVLLCDAQGNPLLPPLLYNDACAQGVLTELQAIAPANHVVLSATSSLAKLLWYAQQPEFAQARYFMHQADWLAFLLHAQPGISDYHNSLKLGYDPRSLHYPDWFSHPSLSGLAHLLPRVVAPGTAIARVTDKVASALGLNPNCQVCAGTTDSIAAFLASGAQMPGEAVTSLGSTLVLKLLSQTPLEDASAGIYSHRLGDRWLVGGASNTGGAVLRHYFTDDQLQTLSQTINPAQPTDLDYYPLLQPGERFPINDPHLQPRLHPQPENPVLFLYGLLESLARIEAQGYQLLVTKGADPLTKVYTAGGGAQNQTWSQIRQRYLQVPVLRSPQSEAAYGSALLAFNRG
jgi:sugar (pentulose or hexulose) kinase